MAARFSFYYAAIFLVIGIHVPFWPAWLAHRGLDAGEISLILSVAIWVRAFANPFIAHFADRSGAYRRIIAISAAGSIGAYALVGAADGFPALFGLNLLATCLFMALIPLGENLASRSAATHGFDYGRVRLWGSIAFIVAAWTGGFAIDFTGDDAILWMLLAALTGALIAGLCLPRQRRRRAPTARFPALVLLRRKTFLVFILAVSLLQASHAMVYLFSTLHWRSAGIPDSVIGALWAEGVVAEILLFAFSGAVAVRLGPVRLMLIASAAGLIRWTVLAESTDLAALAAVQWLHGLTFGAAHLAAIHYMLRTVPEDMSASAQSLYSGFAVGLAMGLVMLAGGWLFEAFGGGAFHAMTALSVGGGLAAVWLGRRVSASPLRDRESSATGGKQTAD